MRPTTLPPPCAVVMKSGNLNFLEPSGPLQACNGTDLPLKIPNNHNTAVSARTKTSGTFVHVQRDCVVVLLIIIIIIIVIIIIIIIIC